MTVTTAEALPVPASTLVPAGDQSINIIDLGSGRPTVFLHGGGPGCTSWTDFWTTVPYFTDDRRMLLVDMINYGGSSSTPIPGPRWSYHADHIALALGNLGIEGADFVCNSIGGSAGLALAAKYPHLVRKMVVTGSAPMPGGAPMTEELGQEGRTTWTNYYAGDGPSKEKIRQIMGRLEYWEPKTIDEGNVEVRYQNSLRAGQRLLGESMANMGEPEDLTALMKQVQARVLFFWGRFDIFAVPEYALLMAQTVPYGDVFVMDQAGHHMEEERPKNFASLVKTWLDQPADRNE
jgi:pimeloyl-ACP methyl ester carboxylesterase